MSVDYRALITIGFKVTAEEVSKAYIRKERAGEDADAWYENLVDNDRLIQFDCYRDPEFYVYAVPEKTHTVDEGECISVMSTWSKLNYATYEDFIEEFKRDFDDGSENFMENHQFDVYMGLKVS